MNSDHGSYLPTNAFSSLIVHNLVTDHKGANIPVKFRRQTPEPVKGVYTLKPSVLPNGPPTRLPSSLPPPGNFELTLVANNVIGDGRCGTVFSVSTSVCGPSNQAVKSEVEPTRLPELVIKVANDDHVEDLEHEASIYEEMESLQGIAIPHCYGWFQADIEPGWAPIPSSLTPPSEPSVLTSRRTGSRRLSLLILERMGDLLPLGERLDDRNDIWAIFSDISQLGIEQPDMRYSNILYAPNPPSGKVCPYHNRVHKYRIIDFDRARKTDWTLKQHYYEQVGTLGRLLEMMERNIILEPWEY